MHSVPVFNLYQVDIQLQNTVHGSSANFHHLLDLVHDHGGVRFNGPFLGIACIVGAHARDIDRSVVDDHRHDDFFLAGWFTFAIQFADPTRILCGSTLRHGGVG